MKRINFNHFKGFEPEEDILLDTGIILALLNKYDAWHTTVKNLFYSCIFDEKTEIALYVHSGIINEVTYLSERPIQEYMKKHNITYSQQDIDEAIDNTIKGIYELIANDIIILLDSSKRSVLNQINNSRYFGAMDALFVSVAEDYGISLLTIDSTMANKIFKIKNNFPNIRNVYYTTPTYRDY